MLILLFRNRMKLILLLLIFLPAFCFSQNQISGVIVDIENGNGISNATVYIDGSTNGTTTDSDGNFSLDYSKFPCNLIVSHVSYNVRALSLDSLPVIKPKIRLKPRLVTIREFKVMDKNEREKNLQIFKDWFLGADYWGSNAEILNDSILFFKFITDSIDTLLNKEPDIGLGLEMFNTSQVKQGIRRKFFIVDALEPLKIRLPMLGYELRIDLLDFRVTKDFVSNTTIVSHLGYYHFKPFLHMSKRDKRVFRNNRRNAYYNSRQHLGRSLIEGKLAENGYVLMNSPGQKVNSNEVKEVDIDTCILHSKGFARIAGLKNKTFKVMYHQKWNDKPLDLTKHVPDKTYGRSYRSGIHFLSDTVFVYKSGNTPHRNVMFSGNISQKKIGASLPDDYSPEEEL